MKIEKRGTQVRLSGYVCAAGRESRVLHHPAHGAFVETVEPGTFARALETAKDVELTLDHGRRLGGTAAGKDGAPARRSLHGIALDEVAVLDITPAYIATTVDAETRSAAEDSPACAEVRSLEDPVEAPETTENAPSYRARLEQMKLEV